MKEQIIVYYNKDKYNKNDYIVKRVLTPDGESYTIKSYYMINDKLKCFSSNLRLSINKLNSFLLQCKKSPLYNRVEYQFIMEV